MTDASSPLSNPVLNGPYDEPTRHFELGPNGPTGVIIEKRRPSEFFIPVPKPRKVRGRAAEQPTLAFVGTLRQRGTL
jgi:type III restriction enzyme